MAIDLSVAIIFRNEIRCLERCLKSLQLLRERFSVEIVMADTGSTDGSRAVAERYADVVFDFPWVNDFSAARNAVLERCSGAWTLVIDCDEWLDESVPANMEKILRSARPEKYGAVQVTIRNYSTADFNKYTESLNARLLRMAAQPRYAGAIHEALEFREDVGSAYFADVAILLHHDGYVMLNDDSEAGREKILRNVGMLRRELEKEPDNLRRLLQYVDSGAGEADYLDALKHAVALVRGRKDVWQLYGAAVLGTAVAIANKNKLPEREEWIESAQAMFPDSYFTRIDVDFLALVAAWNRKDYAACAELGERNLQARVDFAHDPKAAMELRVHVLQYTGDNCVSTVHFILSDSYHHLGEDERALQAAEKVCWTNLFAIDVEMLLGNLLQIFCETNLDTAPVLRLFWKGIREQKPDEKTASAREKTFLTVGHSAFEAVSSEGEALPPKLVTDFFLPLRGECILGDAAALMRCETPEEADAILASIDDLSELPATAFFRALRAGADFPLPNKPLNVEQMDFYAARLAELPEELRFLAIAAADALEPDRAQELLWVRGLVLAAVRASDWEQGGSMELARAFAKAEAEFLPRCYTRGALDELYALPPLHRFGWELTRAFESWDGGDFLGCVRALRAGLETAPDMKAMAEYLLTEFERQDKERAAQSVSPELRRLAEQVKTLLAAYPPDDPAVAELKKSPVYQKVAYLIEE